MILSEIEILGVMYEKMTTKKPLPLILHEDILPLMQNIQTDIQASMLVSMMWKAYQRGRLFYTANDGIEFAQKLSEVELAGLKKYLIAVAIRILLEERDAVTAKSIILQYESQGGDVDTIKSGRIAFLWNEMSDPDKFASAEQELKALIGVE